MTALTLAPHIRWIDVDGKLTAIVTERDGVQSLLGPEWATILAEVTGERSAGEITQRLAHRIEPAKTMRFLDTLQKRGFVIEAGNGDSALFVYGQAPRQEEADRKTQPAVRLVVLGDCDDRQARDLLAHGGIACSDEAPVTLVLTDDYLRPELETINREQLARGTPWLLAKPEGAVAWLGPLFIPGEGACWTCFASRWRGRDAARRYLSEVHNTGRPVIPPLPATRASRQAALATVPALLERFLLTGKAQSHADSIWTLDLGDGRWERHILVPRPQCPTCGDPAAASPKAPVELRSVPKRSYRDGGHRAAEPQQTYERYKHHISPITGVVEQLTPRLQDGALLSYHSRFTRNRPIRRPLALLVPDEGSVGGGKGLTHAEARTGALAEAIERYAFAMERPPDHCRAPWVALGDEAVDPRNLLHFSERQYAERIKDAHVSSYVPPERFDPERVIGWTAGWSLTEERLRLIPSDFCWYTPDRPDARFFASNSNGCAAGNTLEEASLQGLYELIERDCASLWWYNRLERPAVDIASFREPHLDAIVRYHRVSLGRDVWALDLTADIGIPVIAAVSGLAEAERPAYIYAFGCHLDPTVALERALTELNQLLAFTTGREALPGELQRSGLTEMERALRPWFEKATVENQPHLHPSRREPPRTLADFPNASTTDLLADLRFCVARLAHVGIEVIVVDATRPDIGMPVVRIVAPGLRHYWRELGPGRLYDVPVAMGWLPHPHAEDEMNPFAVVF